MHMLIRHATMEDLDAIEAVEAACFPPAEAASNESLTARVAAYPDHFWLLVNTDDDDTPFPSRVEDGTLVGFVDGMATNEPNLADAMYDDADMHDEHGDWQMIFGVDVAPVYQHRGCASYLLRQVILDAAQAGRKGLVLTCKERLVVFLRTAGIRGRRTVRVDAWQRGLASDEARADARRRHGKPYCERLRQDRGAYQ